MRQYVEIGYKLLARANGWTDKKLFARKNRYETLKNARRNCTQHKFLQRPAAPTRIRRADNVGRVALARAVPQRRHEGVAERLLRHVVVRQDLRQRRPHTPPAFAGLIARVQDLPEKNCARND